MRIILLAFLILSSGETMGKKIPGIGKDQKKSPGKQGNLE